METTTRKRPAPRDQRPRLSTRQKTIALAVATTMVAAAVLSFGLFKYRQSVDDASTSQTALVATRLIEKGTAGDAIGSQHLFKAVKVTGRQIKTGAFADPSALRSKVAATDIYPGEQLTGADFTDGGGVADKLAAGQRAVSVPVDAGHGLIGDVHPGDHVDVYAGFLVEGGLSRPRPFMRLLISNVLVLNIHTPTKGGIGQNGANQISDVVLRVDDAQSTQLAFSSENGKVWLALRPGNASPALDSHTVHSLESVLFGSKPVPLKGSGL
jgi:Flp pilus assembly protein CpaB